ncbi:hypothetical protein ACWDKQ_02400 [Saccharopolyspora sp. NPDC000995]
MATLWATGTIGSSLRQYYDYHRNDPVPAIAAPWAVALSQEAAFADFPKSSPGALPRPASPEHVATRRALHGA